jgi:hypothetical protein
MTPTDMVTAMGRATRDAARSAEPASEFSRGQLMSVYSASRHLAVDVAQFPTELRAFTDPGRAGLLRAAFPQPSASLLRVRMSWSRDSSSLWERQRRRR